MSTLGHTDVNRQMMKPDGKAPFDSFVLEKEIFSSVFEKDIRRVYLYKKSERLAKAIHLVGPAFKHAHALRGRLERISMEIVDASVLPPLEARDALSRELLALSSILSIGRTAGYLSAMNADLISREAHLLLSELASYEEPKLSFEDTPSLATLSKSAAPKRVVPPKQISDKGVTSRAAHPPEGQVHKGQSGEVKDKNGRRASILSVLKAKGPSYIKDISTIVREVSEKTIQRELQALVLEGKVRKEGERRWTTYMLIEDNASVV